MRTALLIAALLTSAPAFAAEAPAAAAAPVDIHAGTMLRDAQNYRLGNVNRVNEDGSVGLIIDSKFVTIPADTLSIVDGKAVTSLTKREIISMR